METLEEVVIRLHKAIEDSGPSNDDFIFNKDAFYDYESESIDEEEDIDYYDDPLYHIYRLYDIKECCTIEEIEIAAYGLAKMMPVFRNATLQKEYQSYLEFPNQKSKEDIYRIGMFFMIEHNEIGSIRYEFMNKLCKYYFADKDRWRVSERYNIQSQETHEIRQSKLMVIDYVVKKYAFLLKKMDKIRTIEKEIMPDDDQTLTCLSPLSIINAYSKKYKYEKNVKMCDEIINIKNIDEIDEMIHEISDEFRKEIYGNNENNENLCISDEDREFISNYIIREMDSLMKEVPIYHNLYGLMHSVKKITRDDIDDYFELTKNKNNESFPIVNTATEHIKLRIREDDQLIAGIDKIMDTYLVKKDNG